MNLNDDVVYRCVRLGPLYQRHPGVPAAWSVTTIAFMGIVSSGICLFGGNVAAIESPFDISCQGPWVVSESEGGTA